MNLWLRPAIAVQRDIPGIREIYDCVASGYGRLHPHTEAKHTEFVKNLKMAAKKIHFKPMKWALSKEDLPPQLLACGVLEFLPRVQEVNGVYEKSAYVWNEPSFSKGLGKGGPKYLV